MPTVRRLLAISLIGSASLVAIAARAQTHTTLYAFKGGNDGANPRASLIYVSGKLYGTTIRGGGSGNCGSGGCGTVFRLTKVGAEKVVHTFTGGNDGAGPAAALVSVDGALYGTSEQGGGTGCSGYGCGTVFSVTPAGAEKVIYAFKGGSDGSLPAASLINIKVEGTLYGTTSEGGPSCAGVGCGTVFSVTPAGVEKVVYAFNGGNDGDYPLAGLINFGGLLHGTTDMGGNGSGTVYKVTTSGTESVVYSFGASGQDADSPLAGLINLSGTLYGTTYGGGCACGSNVASGTVFKLTKAGAETVLYSFKGNTDGSMPWAGLINVGGTLYGTTSQGGSSNCVDGCGTVFSVTRAGVETVMYAFHGGSDGESPVADLIKVGGTLYGTTLFGGSANCPDGCGTVFSVTP